MINIFRILSLFLVRRRTVVFFLGFGAIALPNQHVLAITVSEPWYAPAKQRADPFYDDATLAKMKEIKINVQWDNVSLRKALEDLTLKSKQSDPKHEGVRFTSKPPLADQKVSLALQNASLDDILGYLSGQAKFQIKIHKGEVLVLPLKTP